ncbi:hypothetical protein LOTGIDRAFT_170952 [Lottia gigantea]|uniref:Non-haem dioxygenase N-terminal domain-containing protein n=1 Tax=Lottia gigantea TaxID=225164 RepID=V4BEM6_LOTGI|nr:hypothetical protein LOTGIDRAFT_170952 [Lottia gigantea]ESP04257.1 hypothetical protein LOTGIDRAFT_170952 [Lottia gigantea]
MADLKLPIINLAKAADLSQRQEVAKTLCDAAANIGFFYVENVKGYKEDELARWCQWIFDQPKSVTSKLCRKIWNPENDNVYRGFFPTVENDSSFKEAFEIGYESRIPLNNENNPWFNEGNVWPLCEGSDEFKIFATAHFDLMVEVCLELCRLFCLGSGLEENSLEYAFVPGAVSTLRFLHYPIRHGPVPEVAFEGETAVCTCGY